MSFERGNASLTGVNPPEVSVETANSPAPAQLSLPASARHVAGHLVDLEIDEVAGLWFAPGRDGKRARDEKNLEDVALDRIDG